MKRILLCALILILFSSIVSSLSFADLLGYITKNNAPSTELITPVNDGVTNKLIFNWMSKDVENDPQTEYLLQLDDDWRFESPYNIYGLSETSYEFENPLPEGIYYWRVQTRDAYGWGGWSKWRKFGLDLSVKTCSDGTLFWKCSSKMPNYCDGGSLIEDCRRCGCNANEVCQANGLCEATTCNDGTRYGVCSRTKPKLCQNGNLIDVCSICGCSGDLVCQANGECAVLKIIVEEQQVQPSKTLLEYIVTFFKKLFGAL